MIVQREDGTWPVLTETPADNEAQLREIMKDNPDLLPIDEFGMAGPLLVVGRETSLPSGKVDLLCIARGGEVLIIEFKKGPENTDFRRALAQLLDYGSDLWRMTYEEFENAVAVRFFAGPYCHDARLQGQSSLDAAALAVWPDRAEEEGASFREKVGAQLTSGAFHYLVVAQHFVPTIERTIEYLNATMPGAQFYAVELVRFAAGTLSAFESRTVLKPAPQTAAAKQAAIVTEAHLLEQIADPEYREAVQDLFEAVRGLGLQSDPGSRGLSIRLKTPDKSERLSVAWIFPPGVPGWMQLRDLTLGVDPGSAKERPSTATAIANYLAGVEALPDTELAKASNVRGRRLRPEVFIQHRHKVLELLAQLVQETSAIG